MAATEERVSRGRLLKRVGVGAAALGAGSMLTATTAGASAPPATACATAGGCGDCVDVECPGCLGHDCCFCFVTVEGNCFCGMDVYCSDHNDCTKSSQCPPGFACIRSACDAVYSYGTQCVPTCGKYTHYTVCSTGLDSRPSTAGKKTASNK